MFSLLSLSPELYSFLQKTIPFLVFWSFFFTLFNTVRIFLKKKDDILPDSAVLTEMAGLPLTLLQTVCFYKAFLLKDYLSLLLFLWWGPGFFLTLLLLLVCKIRKIKFNWFPFRIVISYLCKITYVLYIIVFWYMGIPGMIFVFSAWIINDQYGRAFLSLDADRFRRTFDDYWILRILYPAGLLVPYFYAEMPYRLFCLGYGTLLLLLWITGLASLYRKGRLLALSEDPTLLRNMVYFPDRRKIKTQE